MANRAAKRAADIIQVAAQFRSTLEEAAVYVDERRVAQLARLAQLRLQLQASEAAAHQAEVAAANATAVEAAAAETLDEFQAALDAALEAAGTDRPGFVLESDGTGPQFRYTMEDADAAHQAEVAAANAAAAAAIITIELLVVHMSHPSARTNADGAPPEYEPRPRFLTWVSAHVVTYPKALPPHRKAVQSPCSGSRCCPFCKGRVLTPGRLLQWLKTSSDS